MKVALDNYQMKAINSKGKNTLVVAAPGSGKTTVIINRVNHLIEERKVKVGNIIVITFTRAAAENMKSRYKNIFKKDIAPFFGTFHGLFYKILLREGFDIKIIDGGKGHGIVKSVLGKYFDDVNDDKSLKSKFESAALAPYKRKFNRNVTMINDIIEENLNMLSNLEKNKEFSSIDEISHPFSLIVAKILELYPEKVDDDCDELRYELYDLGYALGKWIYLIDALDDLKDDLNTNNFNPYNVLFNSNSLSFDELILSCINEIDFYISNCLVNCSDFLKIIPFKKHYSIIDNVINLGIINKYYEILNKIPAIENNKINTSS